MPFTEIWAPLASKDTITGVIIGEIIVDTVVIPTEKATSPPQRYDMMLDDTPPGQQPTRISPRAMASGRCNIFVNANARNGIIAYCAIAPIQISNGRFLSSLKSSVVRVSPILNIIIPMIIDWLVNLLPTKSTKSLKLTHFINDGTKNVTTAIAITTTEV